MENELNLNSSVGDKYFTETYSDTVTQIIHFKDGIKRTFSGVKPKTIRQGQFTKFKLKDGSMIMINDDNVLCIEIFTE
jgi:hypothetical protein